MVTRPEPEHPHVPGQLDLTEADVVDEFKTPAQLPGPTPKEPKPERPMSPFEGGVAAWLTDLIAHRAATSKRSLSRRVGPSGLGVECERQLTYAANETAPVNFGADPLAALIGTAFHTWLAGLFQDLDAGSGRYRVEERISYAGINGTPDLYDRRTRTNYDWKTCKLSKLRGIRRDGPPRNYVIQSQVYAAGLAEEGERPERVALVFIPVDGKLTDIYVWSTEYDPAVAEAAVDRYAHHRGLIPMQVKARPSRLCPWCAYYQPGVNGGVGCPGNDKKGA